jgi:hypothetical protein
MYSPSLEILLKSIKQSTENPTPFKKEKLTDLQSGLPFKLFPTINRPKFSNKKIVIVADKKSNMRLVESILLKLSKVTGFVMYYHGSDINSVNANVATKLVGELNSVCESLSSDIVIMFGIDGSFKRPNVSKVFLVLEQQSGLLLNTIDLINKGVDRLYVFSEFYKKTLMEQGIQKPIHVIKLGLDTSVKQADVDVREQLSLAKDSFVIVNLPGRIDLAIMAFAELVSIYPESPLILMCITTDKYALDIFKYGLTKFRLPVHEHIDKLYLTEKSDLAYSIADVGLNTDDEDKIRYDFLDFISYGKPQIVPSYGFYTEYCSAENDMIVEITGTSVRPSDLGLGLKYSVEPKSLVEALKEHFDRRPLNKYPEKKWGQWCDDFIKSLV